MAGRTRRVDLDQQRIAIAVGPELLDLLHIAARRALVPELLTAAAPNHVVPVLSVSPTDSSFIQATISTSPVSYC